MEKFYFKKIFIFFSALLLALSYQPISAYADKLTRIELCQLIHDDIDLRDFIDNADDCLVFLDGQLNERTRPNVRILYEAIDLSDAKIVESIWLFGGKTKRGDGDAVDLILNRIETDLIMYRTEVNKLEKQRFARSVRQFSKLILTILRQPDSDVILERWLSQDLTLFSFQLINNFCNPGYQILIDGNVFFQNMGLLLGRKISIPKERFSELKHLSVLSKVGVLDDKCVKNALSIFLPSN